MWTLAPIILSALLSLSMTLDWMFFCYYDSPYRYLWSWWGSREARCRYLWNHRRLRFRLRCWQCIGTAGKKKVVNGEDRKEMGGRGETNKSCVSVKYLNNIVSYKISTPPWDPEFIKSVSKYLIIYKTKSQSAFHWPLINIQPFFCCNSFSKKKYTSYNMCTSYGFQQI